MKDVINNMISHPIKTAFVIGSIGVALSDIIRAIRGKAGAPVFNVAVGAKPKKNTNQEG